MSGTLILELNALVSKEHELLIDLKHQLEKDLHISISSEAPEDLLESVLLYVQGNLSNSEYLRSLMYRIDVSEKALAEALQNSIWSETEVITWCILKREWQKILFKKRFSR